MEDIRVFCYKDNYFNCQDSLLFNWIYESNVTMPSIWGRSVATSLFVDEQAPNWIFVNQNLTRVIRSKLRRSKKRKDFIDHYLYVCGTIHYLKSLDKRYRHYEYVPVNYETMSSVISRDKYIEIMINLQSWGIIEIDPSYQAGSRSKGFKLLSPYNQNIKKKKIKDELINRKLNMHRNGEVKEISKMPLSYQYLSITNRMIEVDYRSAYSYNQQQYFSSSTSEVHDANFYALSAYKDKDYRFKVDKFGNRAHTNLTNLKSDLRCFLHVEGEELGQVDIANSQPLFFYMHIKDVLEISDLEKEKYKELVESGKFYEFFMRELGIPFEKKK